jgi:SAM-dependent methyltransferase
MAKRLEPYGVDVVSIEPLPEGARGIARMGAEVFCGTLEDLALPSGSIPAVGLFDVVEHLPEPAPLLSEVARVLSSEGLLFVTVPAYQWLWSAEDQALGHCRRYSVPSLRATLEGAGFSVIMSRHLFASLVPAAALIRALPYRLGIQRAKPEAILTRNASRLEPSAFANHLAERVLAAEARLARAFPLPFWPFDYRCGTGMKCALRDSAK